MVPDPEKVPEQTLTRRALVESLKTRVGPPAELGANVPTGTTSTSTGRIAPFWVNPEVAHVAGAEA